MMRSRRMLLLAAVLLGYLHAVLRLDQKPLWWDESLSLQRVEQPLADLLRGVLWVSDNLSSLLTIDQHPFFYFLVQGTVVAGAGIEEFAVRYASVMAATLFVPAVWVLANWLVRREIAPPATPWFALLLAATSPFLLWFGQEARPYATWAMLTALATYLLLRATEDARLHRSAAAGFVAVEFMALTTHYFAVLMLPFQALVVLTWAIRSRHYWALAAVLVLLGAGGAVGLYAAWLLVSQGGGGNFSQISLPVLIPDMVNAFSLGLSVDYGMVWWIDLIFGLLALLGIGWGLRNRRTIGAGGWILPAFFVIAIAMLLSVNAYRPLYMTARHLSQFLGGFILAVSIGLAVFWARQRAASVLLAIFLLGAVGYSTVNYYVDERYAKDDFPRLGDYMQQRMMPGDLILYYQPATKRLFEYYVPFKAVNAAIRDGANLSVYGAPLLNRSIEESIRWIEQEATKYRRVWLLRSGNHTVFDPDGQVERWLDEHFTLVRDVTFFSQSSLRAKLYLPELPVYEETLPPIQHPVQVEFGNLIRLVGFDAEPPRYQGLPSPVRLYWQAIEKPDKRYRYIWQLVARDEQGNLQPQAVVEREPYEGDIPTTYWDPGKTLMESVELPPLSSPPPAGAALYYTLQVYDAETFAKLPVTAIEGGETAPDGVTALFAAEAP